MVERSNRREARCVMAGIAGRTVGREMIGRFSARLAAVMATLAAAPRHTFVIEPGHLRPGRHAGMAGIARSRGLNVAGGLCGCAHRIVGVASFASAARNGDMVESCWRPSSRLVAGIASVAGLDVGGWLAWCLNSAAAGVATSAILRGSLEHRLHMAGITARLDVLPGKGIASFIVVEACARTGVLGLSMDSHGNAGQNEQKPQRTHHSFELPRSQTGKTAQLTSP